MATSRAKNYESNENNLAEVNELIAKRDELQRKLSIAEGKLSELEVQLGKMKEQVQELFGTTDLEELQDIEEQLINEATELLSKLDE